MNSHENARLAPEASFQIHQTVWIAVDVWQTGLRRKAPNLSKADHAQHPVGRVGTPPDIGALAAFLLSERAGFITGANYVVDGGTTRKMIYVE